LSSLTPTTSSRLPAGWMRRCGRAALLVGVCTFALGVLSASAAYAAFPSSPLLDNFATDVSLNSHWITPSLGEGAMYLTPTHQLSGRDGTWDAALWNTPFSSPVEVWATVGMAGTSDANLYANVTGGQSGSMHPSSGYFADFGGTKSGGSPSLVSLWRVDGIDNEKGLTFVTAPYTNLSPGDAIGLSITNGTLIAWYKPVGGSWTAVVSWHDLTYRSGNIAIEALPGTAYGFTNFGGGTPTAPVSSTLTTASIAAQASTVRVGRPVTYTATVRPTPDGGTVAFLEGGTTIPGCSGLKLNAAGQASCTTTYSTPGSHSVVALYTGSPDGAFVGTETLSPAKVTVSQPTATTLTMSNGTPAVHMPVVYSVRVTPAPDGGTVRFTDNRGTVKGCAARPVVRGLSTCTAAYGAPGMHAIGASYSGDTLYGGSATSRAALATVFSRPRFGVGAGRVVVTLACPKGSRGCRAIATGSIRIPGSRKALTLRGLSTRLKAGRSGKLVFVLTGGAQKALSSYRRHHPHGHVVVIVRLAIRVGDGSHGTQALSDTVRNLGAL